MNAIEDNKSLLLYIKNKMNPIVIMDDIRSYKNKETTDN